MNAHVTRRGFLLTAGGVAVAMAMPSPAFARGATIAGQPIAGPPITGLTIAGLPIAADFLTSDHFETQPPAYPAGAVLHVPRLRRLYIGTTSSHPSRQSLAVLPLDADATPSGPARWFADHPDPLDNRTVPARSKVTGLAWHESRPDRLYVGLTVFSQPGFNRTLVCYRLDRDGWPVEPLSTYDLASTQVEGLRFHPSGRALYVLRSITTPHLLAYPVTRSGELSTSPVAVDALGGRKLGADVHPNGSQLYVFTHMRQLVTVPVDPTTGLPNGTATPPQPLYAGVTKEDPYAFAVTPAALYLISPGRTLDHLPLDDAGMPGPSVVRTDDPAVGVTATADPRTVVVLSQRTFTDAVDNQPKVDGTVVRVARASADGSLSTIEQAVLDRQTVDLDPTDRTFTRVEGRPGVGLLTHHLGQAALGHRARGLRIRARVLAASAATCTAQLRLPAYLKDKKTWVTATVPAKPVTVTPGPDSAWLGWIELDDWWTASNQLHGVLLVLTDGLGDAVVEFELARQVDGMPVTSRHRIPIDGNYAGLVIPGYGHDRAVDLPDSVRETPAYYAEHRRRARAVRLTPRERPTRFLVFDGVYAFDSRLETVRTGLDTVAMLGANAVNVTGATIGLPAREIRRAAERVGIHDFRLQAYINGWPRTKGLDGIYAWEFDGDAWIRDVRRYARDWVDVELSQIAMVSLQDEPAFAFPQVIEQLGDAGRDEFETFLRTRSGLRPSDFGAASWKDVAPLSPREIGVGSSLAIRRRHLWTQRFVTDGFSRAVKAATELARGDSPAILTATNLQHGGVYPGTGNGLMNLLAPGRGSPANADGVAQPDPFHLARTRAVSCLWTETSTPDAWAQHLSFHFDLLRSAARSAADDGGEPLSFGAYLTGANSGEMEGGATYQMFALVGRGAKALESYTYGPRAYTADGWSDNESMYRHLADAARLLGRAEPVLHPGRPRAGSVALWYPQASQYWDFVTPVPAGPPKHPVYKYELEGLHFAHTHAQLPVDFLDDTGLESGALDRYQVVYLTAPNLSVRGQEAVLAWVRRGGTAVLTPGACSADEDNEPTTVIARARGARIAPVERTWIVPPCYPAWLPRRPITRAGQGGPPFGFPVETTSAILEPTPLAKGPTESVLAVNDDGSPAVLAMPYGRGRLISFGYWPGVSYLYSPQWPYRDNRGWPPPQRRPWGWDDSRRAVTTWPAELAGAARHVTSSRPGVEALLLESDAGIAITLLDWSDEPIDEFTITVPGYAGAHPRVESCRGTRVRYDRTTTGLAITLGLENVDVITISER